MQRPRKIKLVLIHAGVRKVLEHGQATLPEPMAVVEEEVVPSARNSLEVRGEHKEK